MPDPHRQSPSFTSRTAQQQDGESRYRISRKGSVYNILGPEGRIFPKYKSASVVGPRWEELTHTPWPYESSAYESGMRLWELGLIERRQVGQRRPALDAAPADAPPPRIPEPEPEPAPEQPAQETPAPAAVGEQLRLLAVAGPEPAPQPVEAREDPAPAPAEPPQTYQATHPAAPPVLRVEPLPPGLPAPRIDLSRQRARIDSLRRDPARLFEPDMRAALQTEVEYHLPQAAWAAYLLRLLDRYERRQRRQSARRADWQTIMHKHIAWQEQRQQAARV